jgi:hypothetical protein
MGAKRTAYGIVLTRIKPSRLPSALSQKRSLEAATRQTPVCSLLSLMRCKILFVLWNWHEDDAHESTNSTLASPSYRCNSTWVVSKRPLTL